LYSPPGHSAASERRPRRNRIVGFAVAASATLVTGIALSPPAQASGTVWDRVAFCESSGNWAISTGNGYYGGLQFSASTWAEFGGTRHAASANRASRAVQIAIARRVLATQGPGAWPVCGLRAGLTRASGAAVAVTVSRSPEREAGVVHAGLVVDGRMGPKTTRATQRWLGTAQNGVLGSTTVKSVQHKVGASADGIIGPRTVRALQTKIGARRDGARYLNAATVAALQRFLNLH
jgi:peptidoglycan hydrolase-like protein with peptidoglycan-binding domain